MDLNTREFSDEEIKKFKKLLEKAKPYTQKEIDDIPFDSCDFDIDRMRAFNAQRALKELGLL